MRLVFHLFLGGIVTSPGTLVWETELVPQEALEAQEQAPETAAAPTRVVGQARSIEELDAFQAILTETHLDLRISKSREFLEAFSDSGLTAMVHAQMAEAYRGKNNIDGFLKHGEEALKEIPNLPNLLATMAFFYAEKKQPLRATDSANRALEILGTMERSNKVNPSDWATQRFFLSAEAHYVLGRVALGRAQQDRTDGSDDTSLREAAKHFHRALEANPTHEYAAFRLAETYERQRDVQNSVKFYARTIAIGRVIGPHATQRLDQIYETTKSLPAREKFIAAEKLELEGAKQERQKLLAQIVAEGARLENTTPPDHPEKATETAEPPSPPPSQETPGLGHPSALPG